MLRGFRNPLVWRARVTGRCLWEVELADGKYVNEVFTDWDDLSFGRKAIRLITPQGPTDWLTGFKEDAVFQMKPALLTVGVGRETLGHAIGAVTHPDGRCVIVAWDYRSSRLCPPTIDNVFNLRYEGLGPLALQNVGVRL